MEKETLFLSYVRWTFKRWAGLQAAINDGMGGPYAQEKELWMGNEVENYFKKYEDTKPEDIEEYLGEMIENEFNTYFEDNSVYEVSQNLCRAYELSRTNPLAPIFQAMCVDQNAHQNLQSIVKENEVPVEFDDGDSIARSMDALKMSGTNEEGWTTVTRKARKK